MDPPGTGAHASHDTVGHGRGDAPLVLAPTLGLCLLPPVSCSLGQASAALLALGCRPAAGLHGGEVVKCLQGRPQCQQQ